MLIICESCQQRLSGNDVEQIFTLHVLLLPSSTSWYWSKGCDISAAGKVKQPWELAGCSWVYD